MTKQYPKYSDEWKKVYEYGVESNKPFASSECADAVGVDRHACSVIIRGLVADRILFSQTKLNNPNGRIVYFKHPMDFNQLNDIRGKQYSDLRKDFLNCIRKSDKPITMLEVLDAINATNSERMVIKSLVSQMLKNRDIIRIDRSASKFGDERYRYIIGDGN